MSKSTTEPFRVVCKLLDGRINSADGLLFLDAILYHGWFAKYAPRVLTGEQRIADAGFFGLPLRQLPGNRWAASCGFYRLYDTTIEYWTKKPKYGGLEGDKYFDLESGTGRINVKSGQQRAYRMPNIIRTVGDIEFYGYGTVEKVRNLLSYIPAVGKKPAEGWGMVREWIVEPWDKDWTTEGPYGLMRPMPLGEWEDGQGLGIRQCGIRPPYWKACNQDVCYVPEVVIGEPRTIS